MPTIKTKVDDETYRELTKMRKAMRLPSVSALFLRKCGKLDDQSEALQIVEVAMKRAKLRTPEEPFRLKDLFAIAIWDGFEKSARLRAGKIFFEQVSAAKDGIAAYDKTSSGQQRYIRHAPKD